MHFPEKPLALLLFLGFLVGLIFCHQVVDSLSKSPKQPADGRVVVEVEGNVPLPGAYCFSQVPTLREVLAKGGISISLGEDIGEASKQRVEGGSRVLVREVQGRVSATFASMAAGKRILFGMPMDLNRAAAEDLSQIPGIGPAISQDIIAYRKKQGLFQSIGEIRAVKGIGEKKTRRISKYLTVRENVNP